MKSRKLKIENLKVESFVTSLLSNEKDNVKGGATCITFCGGEECESEIDPDFTLGGCGPEALI